MNLTKNVDLKHYLLHLLCALVITILTACSDPVSVEEVNSNPGILNDKEISSRSLTGLNLKNTHIKNLKLKNINAAHSMFSNITFENCTFSNVRFEESNFKNVAFVNCVFKNNGKPDLGNTITRLSYSSMQDVLFERCSMEFVDFNGIKANGFILFKNIDLVLPRDSSGPFASFQGGHVRIDNCQFGAGGGIYGDKSSTVMIRSSHFSQAGTYGKIVYIENTKFSKNAAPGALNTLVILNSTLSGDVTTGGHGYLLDNVYENEAQEIGPDNTLAGVGIDGGIFYIYGSNENKAAIRIIQGAITLDNMHLAAPAFTTFYKSQPALECLNMKNVTLHGGNFKDVTVLSGKWENVKIYPEIDFENTNITNVEVFNIEFPSGKPQKESETDMPAFRLSPKPFEWKKVYIPSHRELGLTWWPDTNPGYSPQ